MGSGTGLTLAHTTTVVVMGVSGSGKSSVAAELVRRTGWPFAEADELHSAANVAKMRSGQPLTDADRWPWLAAIAAWIGEREQDLQPAIVTCSALKRSYRDRLRSGHSSVWFAYLAVPPDTLSARLAQRHGHYMPASLLPTQLAELEPLSADEPGITITVDGPAERVASVLLRALPTRGG